MIFEENSTVRKVNNVTTYFSDICGTIKTFRRVVELFGRKRLYSRIQFSPSTQTEQTGT